MSRQLWETSYDAKVQHYYAFMLIDSPGMLEPNHSSRRRLGAFIDSGGSGDETHKFPAGVNPGDGCPACR